MSSELDGPKLLNRAQAFYRVLPTADFSRSTFVELGEAIGERRPFMRLTPDLKRALFRLLSNYESALQVLQAEEKILAAAFDDNQTQPVAFDDEDIDSDERDDDEDATELAAPDDEPEAVAIVKTETVIHPAQAAEVPSETKTPPAAATSEESPATT